MQVYTSLNFTRSQTINFAIAEQILGPSGKGKGRRPRDNAVRIF